MFFIYPAFLIISLKGWVFIFEYIKSSFENQGLLAAHSLLIVITLLSITNIVYYMILYHPYQNVYFNCLAGADGPSIKHNFELDYWGLSYRKALEHILENDPGNDIKINAANIPGAWNAYLLHPNDRKRIVFVDDLSNADYFVSNYRGHREEYTYDHEFFNIVINDLKIMVAYKLRP